MDKTIALRSDWTTTGEPGKVVDLLSFRLLRLRKANAPIIEALRIMQSVRETESNCVPLVAMPRKANAAIENNGESTGLPQVFNDTAGEIAALGAGAQAKLTTLKRMASITQDSFYQKWLNV